MVFGEQALRLIREKWEPLGLDVFAEELYAILSDPNIPLSHSAPITLSQPADSQEPAIRVLGSDFPSIEIQRDNSIEVTLGADGLDLGDDGQVTANDDNGQEQQQPDTSASVFFGTVLSGSGANYQVALSTGMTVDVVQQQILDDETIPSGTVAIVLLEGDTYKMQVPVWLADLEE